MASVIVGARRHRAALDQPLLNRRGGLNKRRVRHAAVTCADHAFTDDWVSELRGVLDALGLR